MKKGRVLSLLLVMMLLLVGVSIPSHAVELETALQNIVLDLQKVTRQIMLAKISFCPHKLEVYQSNGHRVIQKVSVFRGKLRK